MSALDGLTILRYGHIYDSGGGIEQYLVELNRTLLARNRVRIIQLQLTSAAERVGEFDEGSLKRISLFVEQRSHELAVTGGHHTVSPAKRAESWLRENVLFKTIPYRVFTRRANRYRKIPSRAGEPKGAGAKFREIHQRTPTDLLCLHSAGCADVSEVLAAAKQAGVPAVYVHHFSNDRLASYSVAAHLESCAAVAGVCAVDVPEFVRGRFYNVSDGVDTGFFRPDALTRSTANSDPILFLPARITPTKGQADVIRAAGELKRRGLPTRIVFAGRTDTPAFEQELQDLIRRENLADHVEFAGQLDAKGLRDWYARAYAVAFPTRHHEGLPRILMECQAMGVPPIVYRSGGVAEGIVEGETGFVVPVGDLAAMIERLERLLREPARRDAMGRAGRALIEKRFSLPALAERHEMLYRGALARSS